MKKKYITILLIILSILSLAGCNKKDKYEIEILVPAGSQEAFVYSEEEIMAVGNQITIYAGAGLGDTEVILKPVNENVETGYVAEYLTQGMPIKLDAVKGEWFQVGVAVQNDSDRGPIAVSVEVEGVDVRIAEIEELQAILTKLTYKEIENPWLEGWYLFTIHTNEKTYGLSITGENINFDGKCYKVNESIAKEVVNVIKND